MHSSAEPIEQSEAPDAAASEAIEAARRAGVSPYTHREKVGRVLWNYMGQPAFRLTFHNWYGVRRALLRLFGARVGRNARLRPSVRIEQPWNLIVGAESSIGDRAIVYCLGRVTIGDAVSISQGAHLCAGTHDFADPAMPLVRPPIVIERRAWIAADAFIGPGVTVGEGAILGARGCAMKDLEAWTIYAGNPARALRERPRPVESEIPGTDRERGG